MATQAKAGQSSPSYDGKRIFPDPNFADNIVVEVLSRKLENYVELPYGTAHPNTTTFPSHRLVLQVEQTEEIVVRYYAANRIGQQVYNANISYSGDANAYPIFVRDYIVRRSDYGVITKLNALSGLIDADVTAGGTGYSQATVAVSLAGGTGTGGAVSAIVSDGVVIGLYITAVGNYTVAPTATITGGTGATGTVSIQPQTAVLVKEDLLSKTGDERIDGLYVLVRYIYETLPGPWLPFMRYDVQLGPIQGRRRAVVNTGQLASLTATTKTTYEARDGSAIVSWEIEEINSNGTGTGGNPVFPTLLGSERTVQVRGVAVNSTAQVVAAGSSPDSGDLVISSVVTAINEFLAVKKTERAASLPPTEVWAYWDYVPIPLLVFDIIHTVYCDAEPSFTLTTNYDTSGGSSAFRKHRISVGYSNSVPNPNLSGSAFTMSDLSYDGKIINIQRGNVLNDALSYSQAFAYVSGECGWTEEYTFSATTPSATTFAAGAWYVRSFHVEPWGTTGWKTTLIEFYSASGNPSI